MKIVVRLYLVMELKEVHLHQILLDILSALNGEDSHGTAPLVWDVYGL